MRERDMNSRYHSTKGTDTRCERCLGSATSYTVSYFNTARICLPCDEIERKHPDFAEAQRVEGEAVMAGEMNHPGIGLPPGLRDASIAAREQREPGGKD